MNDDRGKGSIGDVEENGWQSINGEKDNERGNDTSEWGPNTSFGFDSSARKTSSGRVSTQKWTKEVADTNGDQFLRWIDGIIVDTTERF